MTAEIAIFNRSAVALAADSAVTVGSEIRQKIYNTANKLFALSKSHPVGIMIYGEAEFLGVPWETIIKEYRRILTPKGFPTLQEYANDFLAFIQRFPLLQTPELLSSYVRKVFSAHLFEILDNANGSIHQAFRTVEPREHQVLQILAEELRFYLDRFTELPYLDGFNREFIPFFFNTFENDIREFAKAQIDVALDEEIMGNFVLLGAHIFSKDFFLPETSGVVFAGFGEDELFPSVSQYVICGLIHGKLRYKLEDENRVGPEEGKVAAGIMPFAQQEMVHAFISGIDPAIRRQLLGAMNKLFVENLADVFKEAITMTDSSYNLSPETISKIKEIGGEIFEGLENGINDIQETYSRPLIDAVSILPKEELAAMAEALVNLTSSKRKMTFDAETVGGPIDVAVISKGDGFIWIQRKHYFQAEYNSHFFKK